MERWHPAAPYSNPTQKRPIPNTMRQGRRREGRRPRRGDYHQPVGMTPPAAPGIIIGGVNGDVATAIIIIATTIIVVVDDTG